MLVVVALVGLAFIALAVGQAIKLGELSSVLRHPLLGSGAESLATATLGAARDAAAAGLRCSQTLGLA